MAEEENSEEVNQQPSGGGKAMMIVLIVLIVVLLVVVGGLGYFLYSKGVLSDKPADQQQEEVQKKEVKKSAQMYKAAINDLVLNITNTKGREKLMKLSFSLKSVEPTIMAIVEEYKPEIVDIVIAQISSRSSEELLTVGGKALLKEELLSEINIVINEMTANNEEISKDNIKKVLFTTFVIK